MDFNGTYEGGVLTPPVTTVYYTGTETIKNGYPLCYDHTTTGLASEVTQLTKTIGATQAAIVAARLGRGRLVVKPTYATLMAGQFAGVADGLPPDGVTGNGVAIPISILPMPPGGCFYKSANVYTDESCTAGDILGPLPGTWAFGKAVFPGTACFTVRETTDRSVTAGLVNGEYARVDIGSANGGASFSRFFDHFRASNVDKVVANVATGMAGHYLLNGTTAVAFQNTNGSTPAGTGIGELTVVGTTTTIGQIQQAGAQYLLSAGRSLFLRMRVKIDDISDEDWFFGLGTPPTVSAGVLTAVAQVTSGGTAPAGTDYAGFFFDGSADAGVVQCNIRKASGTEQTAATTATLVNNTYVELAMLLRNRASGVAAGAKTFQTFVNGVISNNLATAAVAAAFPDTVPLAWAMSGITGGCIGTIDYLEIIASH